MSNKKIFVGNLSFQVNESDLQIAFEKYGEIDEIKLIVDRETKRSRGFAFILFANEEDANKSLEMNGEELDGRIMRINIALQKKSKL